MLECEEVGFLHKALPFFRKLDGEDQDLISANASRSTYLSGEIILSKERECTGLIIVKSGRIRALYGLKDGKQITLFRLLQGDVCILTASVFLKTFLSKSYWNRKRTVRWFFTPLVDKLPKKTLRSRSFPCSHIWRSQKLLVMDQMISRKMSSDRFFPLDSLPSITRSAYRDARHNRGILGQCEK